jgi:hypothetical protein
VSDPLAHLAFALAAGNGTVDGHSSRTLVAAGLAILQRGAAVVRALHGRRSAVVLPPGAGWVAAMAASEGRAAVLIDPALPPTSINAALRAHDVGVVLTTQALAPRLARGTPHLLLDEVPRQATWHAGDGTSRPLGLESHDGLQLEGDSAVEGSAEEVWRLVHVDGTAHAMTHRDVLGGARAVVAELRLAARDHVLLLDGGVSTEAIVYGVVAPLLGGARVTTGDSLDRRSLAGGASDAMAELAALEDEGVSLLVARAARYELLLAALAHRGAPLDAPVLQHCIATGGPTPDLGALAERWRDATGVPLLQRRPHGPAGVA